MSDRGEVQPAGIKLELTTQELHTLQQALNEVLHGPDAIEEWEFNTRMGAAREEATALLERLSRIGKEDAV